MKFTFQNVFEKRQKFQEACKEARACEPEYKRLISAKTEADFMQVIYDNFGWINKEIKLFEPKFDYAGNFREGFAAVRLNDKWGFIKSDGEYLVEPIFDYATNFQEGFARVQLNGKCGFIKSDGNYLVEPIFDYANYFQEGFAGVQLNNKWYKLNTKGEIV